MVIRSCPTTRKASLPTSFSLIGSFIPVPPGNLASSPGVTSRSSVPCRPHTPWFDGRMRTPSPPLCRLDQTPSLADRFITGLPRRLRPGTSPHALRIPPHGGHPALRVPLRPPASEELPPLLDIAPLIRAPEGLEPSRSGRCPAHTMELSDFLDRALPSCFIKFTARTTMPSVVVGHRISRFPCEKLACVRRVSAHI